MVTQLRPKVARPASITSHRWFPAIVALWFGALFSLGSLAIRAGLLESFVLALHLDTILPAAAPPLGMKARMLVALLLGVIGGGLGFFLGQVLARSNRTVQTPKGQFRPVPAEPEQAPSVARGFGRNVLAVKELDSEPIADSQTDAQTEPLQGRRRGLTANLDDATPNALEMAMPNGEPPMLDLGAMMMAQPEPTPLPAEAEFSPPETDAIDPPALQSFAPSPESCDAEPRVQQSFAPPPISDFAATDGSAPMAPFVQSHAVLGDLSPVQLMDRLAHAIQGRKSVPETVPNAVVSFLQSTTQSESIAADAPLVLPPLMAQHQSDAESETLPDQASEPQNFEGNALADVPSAPAIPVEYSPEDGISEPEPPAVTATMPAALRPVAYDLAIEETDLDPANLHPYSRLKAEPLKLPDAEQAPAAKQVFGAPSSIAEPIAAATPSIMSEDQDEVQETFSSLLHINQHAAARSEPKQSFVRIEEPRPTTLEPVVVFPGQGPNSDWRERNAGAQAEAPRFAASGAETLNPLRRFDAPSGAASPAVAVSAPAQQHDPAETERALKSALANLQRMSGAA